MSHIYVAPEPNGFLIALMFQVHGALQFIVLINYLVFSWFSGFEVENEAVY